MALQEKPYIGITGISNSSEADALAVLQKSSKFSSASSHLFMSGYLVSFDTLQGIQPRNKRYPAIDSLPMIWEKTKDTSLNGIHYHSHHPQQLATQIHSLYAKRKLYDSNATTALQLNNNWPEYSDLSQIKDTFPNLKLIFQLGPRILYDASSQEIVAHLKKYKDIISYALIDNSAGKGVLLDVNKYIPLYDRIKQNIPELTVIFAGGLGPDTLSDFAESLSKFTNLRDVGIDAENRLRTNNPNRYKTELDFDKVQKYIKVAEDIFLG